MEHCMCHVTGMTYSLVNSSPQAPKTVARDGWIACRFEHLFKFLCYMLESHVLCGSLKGK